MLVTQAYKFALDPTPAQERAVKARLDQRERVRRAALSEQLPDDEVERLTRSVVVPWTLAAGLDAWSKSRRGERQGARVGFPRFKRRGRARESFRYTTGSFGVTGEVVWRSTEEEFE